MMRFLFVILISVSLSSCIKDKPQEPITTRADINADKKLLICNEGNYGWGNASISLFDPSNGNVIEDVYKSQNNNVPLGDVCQSITKHIDHYYLVVNNSNKVEIINAGDFKKQSTISGFTSPRYLLPVSYNKAYVNEYYANHIKILDLNSKTITGTIACNGWGDEMVLIYNKVFITNPKSNYCYIINTITDQITDSVNVGQGASSILTDKFSKVWVLSSGNASLNQNGKLICIDPISLNIINSFSFNATDSPTKLCCNKTRDTLYYLNKGVFQFPITNTQLPGSALIAQGGKVFYGLGVNPKDYSIYVSDAIDYIQRSKIEIYNCQGVYITSFNAGIISNSFMFE